VIIRRINPAKEYNLFLYPENISEVYKIMIELGVCYNFPGLMLWVATVKNYLYEEVFSLNL